MTVSETHTSDTAPLSLQQEFLCMFDKGDEVGPFGPGYHHVDAWRIRGRVDTGTLRAALLDVVERHEALRTTVVRGEKDRHQKVLPASPPNLEERDLDGDGDRYARIQSLLNELEAERFDARQNPLLRAVLARFDDTDSVLLVDAHHCAIDSWSMQLIMRDLAARYAIRSGQPWPALPEVPQYRDYATAQLAGDSSAALEYWQDNLAGAEIVTLETDQPRSAEDWPDTSWYRTITDGGARAATERVAAATRSSPFMVLLAAFKVLVRRMTGEDDVVIPTFLPGRSEARFQHTVGSFFNFVPLRTNLAGAATFGEVVARVRATCMAAYTRELPLAQVLGVAPELMAPAMADDRAPFVFQVIQPPFTMAGERIGDLEYTAIWRREVSQPIGSYVPDGMAWCLHLGPSEDIIANIAYTRGLFEDDRMQSLVTEYLAVLEQVTADPDAPL
jgi:hypothetical protein